MDSSNQGQNSTGGSSEAGGGGARRGIKQGDPRVGAGAPQRRGFADKTRVVELVRAQLNAAMAEHRRLLDEQFAEYMALSLEEQREADFRALQYLATGR
jgi:hypothetical protein